MRGAGILIRSSLAALAIVALAGGASTHAEEGGLPLKPVRWPHEGAFGAYDQASLQRGFQIYKEVCSSCHTLNLLSYRHLGDKGGPGFKPAEVEAIAAQARVPAGPDDKGEILDENNQIRTRPALPSDHFAKPFPNEPAARANNGGALPPDLSVIVKARHGGPAYIYSLLTGFSEGDKRPPCLGETPGKYYDLYFTNGEIPDACKDKDGKATIPGSLIGMTPPLPAGRVDFADGTPNTTDQEARDVVAFMTWASDPHMNARKKIGFEVMIYLAVLAGFFYISYRRIWRDVEH
jgi:ubiquinol-cytochrome c reductase cytochrome c1 subunit